MKVIVEEMVDIHKPPKTPKKVVEITESSLWEDSPKIFTLEEEIPPEMGLSNQESEVIEFLQSGWGEIPIHKQKIKNKHMITEKIYKNMWNRVLNPFIPNKSSLEIEEMDSVLLFRNCNITIQKNGEFYIENSKFPDENIIIKSGKLTMEQIQEWEYEMSRWTGGSENSSWEDWKEYNFDKNWKLPDEKRYGLMMKMKFDEEIYQKVEIELSKFYKKLEDLSVEEYPHGVRIEIWGDKLLTIYNVNVFLKKEGIINIQDQYSPSKGIFIYTNQFTKKQLQQWNNKIKLWFPDERFSIWEKWKNNNTREI